MPQKYSHFKKILKILIKARGFFQRRKIFLPFHKKVYLNLRKWSQNKNNSLKQGIFPRL